MQDLSTLPEVGDGDQTLGSTGMLPIKTSHIVVIVAEVDLVKLVGVLLLSVAERISTTKFKTREIKTRGPTLTTLLMALVPRLLFLLRKSDAIGVRVSGTTLVTV